MRLSMSADELFFLRGGGGGGVAAAAAAAEARSMLPSASVTHSFDDDCDLVASASSTFLLQLLGRSMKRRC